MSLEKTAEQLRSSEEKGRLLLREFNSFPDPKPNWSPIETKILTQPRDTIMQELAYLRYQPAAQPILDYIQSTHLTSDITSGIDALGKLGYTEAIPFIESQLKWLERWYNTYKNQPRATGVDVAKAAIHVAKTALIKLR